MRFEQENVEKWVLCGAGNDDRKGHQKIEEKNSRHWKRMTLSQL